MNSHQRRKANRRLKHDYPYKVYYSAINNKHFIDSLLWCENNINTKSWITCDELYGKPYFGYNSLSVAVIRFAKEKDAVNFTLLWVGN